MWPFRSRSKVEKPLIDELRTLSNAVSVLQLRSDQQESAHDALKAQHLALRGRVYALWGKERPATDGADAAGPTAAGSPTARRLSKDELRVLAGVKPGRPYPHREEET